MGVKTAFLFVGVAIAVECAGRKAVLIVPALTSRRYQTRATTCHSCSRSEKSILIPACSPELPTDGLRYGCVVLAVSWSWGRGITPRNMVIAPSSSDNSSPSFPQIEHCPSQHILSMSSCIIDDLFFIYILSDFSGPYVFLQSSTASSPNKHHYH